MEPGMDFLFNYSFCYMFCESPKFEIFFNFNIFKQNLCHSFTITKLQSTDILHFALTNSSLESPEQHSDAHIHNTIIFYSVRLFSAIL